jgi:hypothetical protein
LRREKFAAIGTQIFVSVKDKNIPQVAQANTFCLANENVNTRYGAWHLQQILQM